MCKIKLSLEQGNLLVWGLKDDFRLRSHKSPSFLLSPCLSFTPSQFLADKLTLFFSGEMWGRLCPPYSFVSTNVFLHSGAPLLDGAVR